MGLNKRKNPNRLSLGRILCFSLFVHALLCGLLFYDFKNDTGPFGNGKPGSIAVSLVSDGTHPPREGKNTITIPSPLVGEGQGEGGNSGSSGGGGGGGQGNSIILSTIQSKIERAKFYPLVAKRQNIEGAPVVEFKIGKDGLVEYVKLKQTSGSPLLDEAAQKTVQNAAPYPSYNDPISLSIRYALSDKPYY